MSSIKVLGEETRKACALPMAKLDVMAKARPMYLQRNKKTTSARMSSTAGVQQPCRSPRLAMGRPLAAAAAAAIKGRESVLLFQHHLEKKSGSSSDAASL